MGQPTSVLKDISDGTIYSNFINSFSNSDHIYSFTINTDGVSLADKSNLSIWPIFLIINELPIEERFFIDNIIIAGK